MLDRFVAATNEEFGRCAKLAGEYPFSCQRSFLGSVGEILLEEEAFEEAGWSTVTCGGGIATVSVMKSGLVLASTGRGLQRVVMDF